MKISIFTTYTEPELRNDPWKEALNCYEDFADEVVTTGKDWPYEFKWDLIGKTFQEGFEKSSGDWAIRMDIDYFFHENSIKKLRKLLKKYENYPGVVFPQYQFFTADRFQLKTRLCIALNKKKFPKIKLNGGGDLCLATLNDDILPVNKLPNLSIPIFQYDSMFRTKEIISKDRARFARAWNSHFNNYINRGGPTEKEAYGEWFKQVSNKYQLHTNKINLDQHPIYIKNKLKNLSKDSFGYSAFGLKDSTSYKKIDYIKGKKEILLGGYLNNLSIDRRIYK